MILFGSSQPEWMTKPKILLNNDSNAFAVRVICHHVSGKSRGYGFVRFSSETAAMDALKEMDGQVHDPLVLLKKYKLFIWTSYSTLCMHSYCLWLASFWMEETFVCSVHTEDDGSQTGAVSTESSAFNTVHRRILMLRLNFFAWFYALDCNNICYYFMHEYQWASLLELKILSTEVVLVLLFNPLDDRWMEASQIFDP